MTAKRALIGFVTLALLFSAIINPIGPQPVQAAVLVDEDFKGTTAPDWTFGGSPTAPTLTENTVDAGGAEDGWLRLTEATTNQSGFVFYENAIPSGNGLVVEFDYAIFGGNGADGFTFFLMDGSVISPATGAFGGSLGYAQRDNNPGTAPDPEVEGLTEGYIGIGFDEYGNYANPTEGRIGGPGFRPNWISIRGPYDPTDPAQGYEFLTGTAAVGNLESNDAPPGENHPDQDGEDYRHAQIIITADGAVTVRVQFGRGGPLETIISNYTIGATAPPTVQFGFAASTGGFTNYHEIRNFTVTEIVDVAVTKTHSGSFVAGEQGTYTINVTNITPAPSTAVATGISFTDVLPRGVTFVSASGDGWSCSNIARDVTCVYPRGLPARQTTSVDIVVEIDEDATGDLTNQVTVNATGDANPDNNTAEERVTIGAAPFIVDPALVKFGLIEQALPGEQITWTLIAGNNGTVPVNNVLVIDALDPTFFTPIQDATTDRGEVQIDGYEVTFALGTINPGDRIEMTLTAAVRDDVQGPATANNVALLEAGEITEPVRAEAPLTILAGPAPTPTPTPAQLPATGYPPQPQAMPIEAGWLLGGAGLLGIGLLIRRRSR